jgi:hypothetical protein
MKKTVILSVLSLFVFFHSLAQQIDTAALQAHVTYLASDELLGRGFGSEQGKEAAEYIISNFKSSGVVPLLDGYRHSFTHRTGSLNIIGNNIVGLIEGSDPDLKDEYIIIGAHYDHVGWEFEDGDTVVYNGADDNASGVAGILEIGRYFGAHREKLKRSLVLIAFDGEETGLIGSTHFVKEGMMDFDRVKAMFSLDMIGMYEKHGGVDLLGIEQIREQKQLLEAALSSVPVTINKQNDNMVMRTDTQPFGSIGIPSTHVFTGTESPYHKPEDDSDLLDYDGMALITEFLVALVEEMSAAPELTSVSKMEGRDDQEGMKRFNPGIGVNIGSTYHDYPNEFYKAKPVFSYAAGITLETRITQWLAIQPEVLYEWGGSQHAGGTFRTHSVTVPVNLLFTTPDPGNNGVRFFYQLGGYYSYSFAGSLGGTELDFASEYNDADYGYVIGVGLEIRNFRIGYVSITSMTNRLQDEAVGNLKGHGNFARIGWVF